jgi:hypothetical protein
VTAGESIPGNQVADGLVFVGNNLLDISLDDLELDWGCSFDHWVMSNSGYCWHIDNMHHVTEWVGVLGNIGLPHS